MNRTKRSAILRRTMLCVAGAAMMVCSSQTSRPSTRPLPPSQEPETRQSEHDCDIDESVISEDCPSETIISQYKERYDITAVLRGGLLWEAVSGQYVNEIYGYTVNLPDGVEGLCALPPAPWHGFVIDVANVLSRLPQAPEKVDYWTSLRVYLYIDGSYNSAEYESADDAADDTLGGYEDDHPDDLVILKRDHTKLRGVPATRFLVQFADAQSGETTIVEEVFAIRDDTGMIYSLGLTTTAARYDQDKRVLRDVIKGLRFTPIE